MVYLAFAAVVAVGVVALAAVLVDRTTSAVDRIDTYVTNEDGRTGRTGAENDVDRLQAWLDGHGLERIQVEESVERWLDEFGATDVTGWTQRALDVLEGAAVSIVKLLFSLVLIVVVSVYMLLDMPRFARFADRRFPPLDGGLPLTQRVERALVGYVNGQLLVSVIIGASAGLGMYVLGVLGWVPGADDYALVFGAWVAFTELIPYVGPWLGSIPPALYALVVDPISFIWVALLFLGIHQIEGHVVIPNVMGSALRLHPLLVIFGLLAGAEIYGLAGALVALPGARRRAGRVGVLLRARQARAVARGRGRRGRGRADAAAGRSRPVSPTVSAAEPLVRATGLVRRFGARTALARRRLRRRAGRGDRARRPERRRQVDAALDPRPAVEPLGGRRSSGPQARRTGWAPQRAGVTAGSRRGRTSSCSRGSAARSRPGRVAERLLARVRPARDERPRVELSVGQPAAPERRARALGAPHVLLLDEPTASLDPGHRRRLWEVVAGVRDEGGAVVFSTQNLEEVERHADRVVALKDGRRGRLRTRSGSECGTSGSSSARTCASCGARRSCSASSSRTRSLIAALVVLVAQFANAKPRVAFVDLDGLPEQVEIGGQTFHVDRTIDRVAREVTLVRLPEGGGGAAARDGRVVAVVTVPPGLRRRSSGRWCARPSCGSRRPAAGSRRA